MNTPSPIEMRPIYHRGRWLTAWCSFSGEPFGGLFTEPEAAYLERATSGGSVMVQRQPDLGSSE